MMPATEKRVAVDIGGTFTDLVLIEGARIADTCKVLTTPSDPSDGVEIGLLRLLAGHDVNDIVEVVHGTTLVSNALIERAGATTALITTKGFRDVLSIRRELRYELYDLFIDMPEPLIPRRLRWEVSERMLSDGRIHTPLDVQDLASVTQEFEGHGVQAVAICLLHSYKNPVHEQLIAEHLGRALPSLSVSLSSDVAPELGEYARASTTAANAYVLPLVDGYLQKLEKRLRGLGIAAPLHVMLSTGGLASVETARTFPIRLLESGPAAGVLSAAHWATRSGERDVLAFDMGGTTAKAALVEDNQPLIANEHEAARVYRFTKGSGLPIRVPVVDLIEIGAGGGSIARLGPFDLPKVGPDSAGADPGPASYSLGSSAPTVTDADLVLGYLNPDYFLGGEMDLDIGAAHAALAPLALSLGLGVEEAAGAIHRVVNENMASAARMHAIERGRDLRGYALVATGGAAPVHAWGVARNLGIRSILFPPSAGVASAIGMLTAAQAFDFSRSLPCALADTDWQEVRRTLHDMEAEGRERLASSGVAGEAVSVSIAVDVRHLGQGDTLSVRLSSRLSDEPYAEVEGAFDRSYTRLYGRRPPGVEPEVMTWRLSVSGPRPELLPFATAGGDVRQDGVRKGSRPVWFPETGFVLTGVYDRYATRPGDVIRGPAVLEERESTAVIGPGGLATVDPALNLEVTIE